MPPLRTTPAELQNSQVRPRVRARPGAATITNNSGGNTFFVGTSTAGNATITTNAGSFTEFDASSTAGSATVITNSAGFTIFQSAATGGTARFITNAGGTFDISNVSSSGITVGSIEGAGAYRLGSKELTVGLNNLSTTVSGTITDGGFSNLPGGSLIKVGTGTLTLTGSNTYTGGTTISGGTLQIGSGGTTGSIVGTVVDNAALVFDRSDAFTLMGT
jgi:autotransporter-associated beta strand protein